MQERCIKYAYNTVLFMSLNIGNILEFAVHNCKQLSLQQSLS